MDTLLECLTRIESLGPSEAVRFSNGLRTWTYSYNDLGLQIRRFATFLESSGLGKDDRVVLWCENRLEWVAVFWAALSRGLQVVPLDPHATPRRVSRICEQSSASLLVYGTDNHPSAPGVESFFAPDLDALPPPKTLTPHEATPDDVVEILFTSGTTSEAKGVVHRHRNICANLTPIDREIQRYRHWARPFQPVRFLTILPLSHMFGQAMGLFVPILMRGAVVFLTDLHADTLERTIRQERVSVLVSVPRILASLESHVVSKHPETRHEPPVRGGVLRRWWRYRALHRAFGWKFWAFVVGGAELDPSVEAFWRRMGLMVVQGYGLTETSPVVAVNHPFHARAGTLGRAIGNQEIKIADDGEILVRGASVVDAYIEEDDGLVDVSDAEGWFHTGDIGKLDTDGRLVFRGRKKDVIVTPDGLNVHPEDVERALGRDLRVRAAVVVGEPGPRGERPHAALILEKGAEADGIIEQANRALEPEQRIQSWSIWPEADFPRTASTEKVQRHVVAEAIRNRGRAPTEPPGPRVPDLLGTLADLTDRRPEDLSPDKSLAEDLALSSLERIDLLHDIEQRYGIRMDEVRFSNASTVGELTSEIEQVRSRSAPETTGALTVGAEIPQPRWTRHALIRAFRIVIQTTLVRPLLACFVKVKVVGGDRLDTLSPPLLLAANHASNLDAPVVLTGLPRRWRRRLAPAVRREFFFPLERPALWRTLMLRIEYYLACASFNVYPLPQHMGQVRESLVYTGELTNAGYCPLVFPEGARTPDGKLGKFRPGIGFMAVRLRAPVVPIYLDGLFDIFPIGACWPKTRWPKRGEVRLEIGEPLTPRPDETYLQFTHRLESAFQSLSARRA